MGDRSQELWYTHRLEVDMARARAALHNEMEMLRYEMEVRWEDRHSAEGRRLYLEMMDMHGDHVRAMLWVTMLGYGPRISMVRKPCLMDVIG